MTREITNLICINLQLINERAGTSTCIHYNHVKTKHSDPETHMGTVRMMMMTIFQIDNTQLISKSITVNQHTRHKTQNYVRWMLDTLRCSKIWQNKKKVIKHFEWIIQWWISLVFSCLVVHRRASLSASLIRSHRINNFKCLFNFYDSMWQTRNCYSCITAQNNNYYYTEIRVRCFDGIIY